MVVGGRWSVVGGRSSVNACEPTTDDRSPATELEQSRRYFRQRLHVPLGHDLLDLRRVRAQIQQRGLGAQPQPVAFLYVGFEIQIGNDLAEFLRRNVVLVLVVALDDALLMRRVI